MSGTPFSTDAHALEKDRRGRMIALRPMSDSDARTLGAIFASIDPWNAVNWPADRLESFLSGRTSDASVWSIHADDDLAGAVAVSAPWLHGAYLHFLGVVPDAQNAGIGMSVMKWFECQSAGHYRNLWICVSAFNEDAERFYRTNGFSRAAVLDDLVVPGKAEVLLRKCN